MPEYKCKCGVIDDEQVKCHKCGCELEAVVYPASEKPVKKVKKNEAKKV